MGQREVQETIPPQEMSLAVPADRLIARIRQDRDDARYQLDMHAAIIEEMQEREVGMLARIAELEEKENK